MKLFDERRICSSGLNLRDLVLFSALVVFGKSLLRVIGNLLGASESVWHGLDTTLAQVELVAEFLAIPSLGLLVSALIRGRTCVVWQAIVIFFLYDIVAYTVARLLVR